MQASTDRSVGPRSLAAAGLLALALLSGATAAQQQQQGGGGYRGPGDIVPPTPARPTGSGPVPGGGRSTAHGPPGRSVSGPVPVGRPNLPPIGFPGSPFTAPPPEAPGMRPPVVEPTSWQSWWHHNRWEHVAYGSGLESDGPASGATGFFLGHGQRVERPDPLRPTRGQIHGLAVPALFEALERRESPFASTHLLLALAQLVETPDELAQFARAAREQLADRNQDVSEKAALAIGLCGDAEAPLDLEALLRDTKRGRELCQRPSTPTRLRAFAALGLGLFAEAHPDGGRERALGIEAALSETLSVADDELAAACVLALGHVPAPTHEAVAARVDALLTVFRDESRSSAVRGQVPPVLARILSAARLAERASVPRGEDPGGEDPGGEDAMRAGPRERVAREFLAALAKRVRGVPEECRNGAILALGRIGTSADSALDEEIRETLGELATGSTGRRLSRYLARVALAQAAGRADRNGAEPLAGLDAARKLLRFELARARGERLAWTAIALALLEKGAAESGALPDVAAAEDLRELLRRARSPEVVGAAAVALGLLRDPESVGALREHAFGSGALEGRAYAALALGMVGATTSREELGELFVDASHRPFALEQIAVGLSLVGDQESAAKLFELLDESADPAVQAAVAAALGWTKDPRPIRPLVERLRSESLAAVSRTWTGVALGRICDPAPRPWIGRWSVGVNYDVDLPLFFEGEFRTGFFDLP